MPLHVSLGLGQALFNEIDNLAIGINNEIKTLNGIPTDEVRHLITTMSELCDQLEQLLMELSDKNEEIKEKQILLSEHMSNTAPYYEKESRKYKLSSTFAAREA